MDVAFFGGSFDPPHLGHELAIDFARARGMERIVVVPVRAHAFGKRLLAYEHRVQLARLAFADSPDIEVSEVEKELAPPNYTVHTLQALRQQHPHWSLRLLVGSDVLEDAQKWYRFDDVVQLAPPLVLKRAQPATSRERSAQVPEVSSTELRQVLAQRHSDSTARHWLAARLKPAVLAYIEQHSLYLE
jgi:nicotinate-nucleotide adenylyltransferase